ncbi:MAG: tRNA epoxyqueuosine(34) reductase QueG [Kofleriaceae bacterium]
MSTEARAGGGAPEALVAQLVARARALGFHRAALVPLEPPISLESYRAWLDAGHAGEMHYLGSPEHLACRADPRALLAEARSMLVVALAHQRGDPPVPPGDGERAGAAPLARLRGRIATYARSEDYHMILRDRLVQLARELAELLGRPVLARSCVDAAPVLERGWAERAGLGFIAKNTMLIAPGLGSHVLLGELLLDLELPPAPAAAPAAPRRRCGGCRACLDACPTQAFVDAYVLDARRCISYLTIEHRGVIPRALRAGLGSWIFGCDVCQDVCPFNAGAGEPHDPALAARDLEHSLPDLLELAGHRSNQLRRFVRRTSLRRVPRDQLLRNVAVALGNSGDARAVAALRTLAGHQSALVRGHAAWALGRLGAFEGAQDALRVRLELEEDPEVRGEVEAALLDARSP